MFQKYHLLLAGILFCVAACSAGNSNVAETATTEDATVTSSAATTSEESSSVETTPEDIDSTAASPSATVEAAPNSSLAPQAEMMVVPGERVGPVTRDTSRAALAAMFGESALQDTEIPVGEGFTESGTTVNDGTDQAFSVIWVDDSQSRPATVKDFGAAWQTPEGIRVGMPYSELQPALGTFTLYGFGWDYGGTVVLEGSNLADYYGELILRLQPDEVAVQEQGAAFQSVQGDALFASNDPNLTLLDLTVDEMIVYLNPPLQ
ncbi:MAG: hypothetical protein AAFX78_00465 [Cyanobacteria bacterium J06638_20]